MIPHSSQSKNSAASARDMMLKQKQILKSLSYDVQKDAKDFQEDRAGLRHARLGASVYDGRLKYYRRHNHHETAYYVKRERVDNWSHHPKNEEERQREELKIYMKNVVASTLSMLMDDGDYITPKEKIFKLDAVNGKRPQHRIASKQVAVKRHIVINEIPGNNLSSKNIIHFFRDMLVSKRQKFELCDALARMMAIHEYDVNAANFLVSRQGHVHKIDNTLSGFHKNIPRPKYGSSQIHYAGFLENYIFENESNFKLYQCISAYDTSLSDPPKVALLRDAIHPEMMERLQQDCFKLALFVSFMQRLKTYMEVPEEIKDYIFSKDLFWHLFEDLPPKEQKEFELFLQGLRHDFEEHLSQLGQAFATVFEKLPQLEKRVACQKYHPYRPSFHTPQAYQLAIEAIGLSRKENRDLHHWKKAHQSSPEMAEKFFKHASKNTHRLSRLFKGCYGFKD